MLPPRKSPSRPTPYLPARYSPFGTSGGAIGVNLASTPISFVELAALANGTTSLTVPYVTTAANDLLVLNVCNKYPANGPATPSGWTLAKQSTGGAGSSGVDTGSVYMTTYYKVADGTESGNVTVTITSGNSAHGRMHSWRFAGGTGTWSVAADGGADNTGNTDWSVTGASDPGIKAGDVILVPSGMNTDGAGIWSNAALVIPGCTVAPYFRITESNTTQGDDLGNYCHAFSCLYGASTGVATYTAVVPTVAANSPAGASNFVRIRRT